MIIRLICLIGLYASVFAMNWDGILDSHNEFFSDKSFFMFVKGYVDQENRDLICR